LASRRPLVTFSVWKRFEAASLPPQKRRQGQAVRHRVSIQRNHAGGRPSVVAREAATRKQPLHEQGAAARPEVKSIGCHLGGN
jgi:hypothetical protein